MGETLKQDIDAIGATADKSQIRLAEVRSLDDKMYCLIDMADNPVYIFGDGRREGINLGRIYRSFCNINSESATRRRVINGLNDCVRELLVARLRHEASGNDVAFLDKTLRMLQEHEEVLTEKVKALLHD